MGRILLSGLINIETTLRVDSFPYEAIRKAVIFASYKIGTSGAAEGFIAADQLEQLFQEKHGTVSQQQAS